MVLVLWLWVLVLVLNVCVLVLVLKHRVLNPSLMKCCVSTDIGTWTN